MFRSEKESRLFYGIRHPVLSISGFILLLLLIVLIDAVVFPYKDMKGVYLIPLLVAGCVFWRNMPLQLIIASLITWLWYFFPPYASQHFMQIVLQWLTNALAVIAVSTLIKLYLAEKEHTLELTVALAKSLDSRDPHTACHSENVAHYAVLIAKELGLPKRICQQVYLGGLLHDIGKIGVPESILTKPGRLTKEEYEVIKQHPSIGFEMVKHIPAFQKRGILDMILYHHERYDGTGYPKGLSGGDIPLFARIMAVADCFDAITSTRVYRKEAELAVACAEIERNKGEQFDPMIVDAFLRMIEKAGPEILRKYGK